MKHLLKTWPQAITLHSVTGQISAKLRTKRKWILKIRAAETQSIVLEQKREPLLLTHWFFQLKKTARTNEEGKKKRGAMSWRVPAVDEGVDSAADADSHFQFRYANKRLPFHPAVVLNETCLWISISSSATVYFDRRGCLLGHIRVNTHAHVWWGVGMHSVFSLMKLTVPLIHLCVLHLQRHVYLDCFIWF